MEPMSKSIEDILESIALSKGKEGRLDMSDPLFVATSDHPGMVVAEKFTGSGFQAWKRTVLMSLRTKNKAGMVDGTITRSETDEKQARDWDRCNSLVMSWLLNALDKDICESHVYHSTAKEIWDSLLAAYDCIDGTRRFNLKQDLANLKQENESVSQYYAKWKKLWDELVSIVTLSSCKCCKCGQTDKLKKVFEEDKLLDFLMGLNENFVNVRGNILLMNPLPSLESGYALVLAEERQRESSKKRKEDSPAAFANAVPNTTVESGFRPQQKLEWQNEKIGRKMSEGESFRFVF